MFLKTAFFIFEISELFKRESSGYIVSNRIPRHIRPLYDCTAYLGRISLTHCLSWRLPFHSSQDKKDKDQ